MLAMATPIQTKPEYYSVCRISVARVIETELRRCDYLSVVTGLPSG
jgi:hypothetical protein